jgi:filamentous hemagglutinin family protein
MEIAMNLSSSRRIAQALGTASIAAMAVAGSALPQVAFGQSFQGTGVPTVVGAATISTGAGTTDIQINAPEVIIDWSLPTIVPVGTPAIFQAANTTATFFTTTAGPQDYTVLNRIQPVLPVGVPGAGNPIDRAAQFNGIVQSTINGVTGGNVWFYSPTGIIVGPTALFSTGSLVLTTNAIDTTGGLYGAGNSIRFAGPANSTGFVNINPGANIRTGGKNGQYFAAVAPRVVQAGTALIDGQIAYVAAEQAQISINAGLLDIVVTQGTTDANGVVHTGTSTGPASGAAVADQQVIQMIAMPKNTALTMLLSGGIGYAPAAVATDDGSAIVLSAGVAPNVPVATQALGLGNMNIGSTIFTNKLNASASNTISIDPATGPTDFRADAILHAGKTLNAIADSGTEILAGGNLSLISGLFETGGSITVQANPGIASLLPGQINVSGFLLVDASASVDQNLPVPASGLTTTGGNISILANGGSINSASLSAYSGATGGEGTSAGGNGNAGGISLTASNGGSIGTANTLLSADGFGGSAATGTAGNGTGGTVAVSDGAAGQTGTLDLGVVFLSALASGGLANDPTGTNGNALGGAVSIDIAAQQPTWDQLTVDAYALAGQPFTAGSTGGTASARPDAISINVGNNGLLTVDGLTDLDAQAFGVIDSPVGTNVTGGGISVTADSGGTIRLLGNVTATADALIDSESFSLNLKTSPNLQGGTVDFLADGGTIVVANLTAQARARGAGATVTAGSATGGTVRVGARNGGTFRAIDGDFLTFVTLNARGLGSGGTSPANATGGTATLFAQNGLVEIFGAANVMAEGFTNNASATGANANGGTASIEVRAGANSSMLLNSLMVDASGYARDPIGSSLPSTGSGGNGTGGTATVSVVAGNLASGVSVVRAIGLGGDGTAPGAGGSGTGGTARFSLANGQVTLGATTVEAYGQGGLGASGGNATGGTAEFRLADTGAGPGAQRTVAGLTLNADAKVGGPGSRNAGATVLTVQPGAVASSLMINGNFVASAAGLAGAAGNGFTGSLSIAPLTITGNADISAFRDISLTVTDGAILDAGGTLTITGGRSFTSTGLVNSDLAALISSTLGISMSNLQSGATTGLQALNGPIAVTSLQSVGAVTASGRSVNITSPGALTFGSVSASAGNFDATTAGAITFNQGYTASGAVTVRAADTYSQTGSGMGSTISIFSTDIVLNPSAIGPASLGARGTTQSITLTNTNSARQTFIGGADSPNGYSLSASEAARLFADQRILITAPALPPATLPADFIVDDLALTYGANSNLGNAAEFKIDTTGRVTVIGEVSLLTSSANDTFTIDPTVIDVTTDTGSIAMLNAAGSPLGTLNLIGGTITVADSQTFSALSSAFSSGSDLSIIAGILDTPTAQPNDAGFLQAGQINFEISNALYIQNTGTGTAFADRRGFTASSVSISTFNSENQISINGVILGSGGQAITGLATGSSMTINDVLANRPGLFEAGSTLNGCFIGFNCRFDHEDVIDLSEPGINKPLSPRGSDSNSLDLPIVGLVENEPEGSPPLVDEPVTGVGNDDLWQEECKEGEQCGT